MFERAPRFLSTLLFNVLVNAPLYNVYEKPSLLWLNPSPDAFLTYTYGLKMDEQVLPTILSILSLAIFYRVVNVCSA
jgi:hypothetical protein